MKMLLTGASGFVGNHLQRYLACIPLAKGEKSIDLRDSSQLRQAIEKIKPDAVIHLAGQSFVPESFVAPQETFDINFLGTYNLLVALKETGFSGKMLFISSGDIYGLVPTSQLPILENYPLKPRSPYAVSKVAAEALCYQWSQTEPFHIVMVRAFNHIGPGQSDRFVVSSFARQIIEIKLGQRDAVIRVGDIDVTRDFTDVRDVVQAYLLLIEQGKNGEVYNVCSGVERSIESVLHQLLAQAGVEARIEQDSDRLRLSQQRRVYGSFAKLHRDTEWKPKIPFTESLNDILTSWQRQLS